VPCYYSGITDRGFFVVLPFKKSLIAVFLIAICTATSIAGAKSIDLFSAQKMNSTNDLPYNISVGINNDYFAGDFTKFTTVSSAFEHKDMPASSVDEYFEDITAISLHKDHDKIIWSLAPSLYTYSLNPISDIKNIQVLLRYRF
jgi:hypothetical protein